MSSVSTAGKRPSGKDSESLLRHPKKSKLQETFQHPVSECTIEDLETFFEDSHYHRTVLFADGRDWWVALRIMFDDCSIQEEGSDRVVCSSYDDSESESTVGDRDDPTGTFVVQFNVPECTAAWVRFRLGYGCEPSPWSRYYTERITHGSVHWRLRRSQIEHIAAPVGYLSVQCEVRPASPRFGSVEESEETISRLLSDTTTSDIAITAGARTFNCHRIVLFKAAPVLVEMAENSIDLEVPVDEETFGLFLEHAYKKRNPFLADLRQTAELLDFANKYRAIDLKVFIQCHIVDSFLDPTNALETLEMARAKTCPMLQEYCEEFIYAHANRILSAAKNNSATNDTSLLCDVLQASKFVSKIRKDQINRADEYLAEKIFSFLQYPVSPEISTGTMLKWFKLQLEIPNANLAAFDVDLNTLSAWFAEHAAGSAKEALSEAGMDLGRNFLANFPENMIDKRLCAKLLFRWILEQQKVATLLGCIGELNRSMDGCKKELLDLLMTIHESK